MSLQGGAQPEFPQSVWTTAQQGMPSTPGPPPQHAPYPSILNPHAQWGASLRDKLAAKTRSEGHDPRVIIRKFVDLAAMSGVVGGAVAFLRYLEAPLTWRWIGAAIALLAGAALVRPRRSRDWDPDWLYSTGSPTRDPLRLAAAGATAVAAGSWVFVKVSGGAALLRKPA